MNRIGKTEEGESTISILVDTVMSMLENKSRWDNTIEETVRLAIMTTVDVLDDKKEERKKIGFV